jgi:hypothetical protein
VIRLPLLKNDFGVTRVRQLLFLRHALPYVWFCVSHVQLPSCTCSIHCGRLSSGTDVGYSSWTFGPLLAAYSEQHHNIIHQATIWVHGRNTTIV